MTSTTKPVSIRINFKEKEQEQISFLVKHYSKTNIHDLIRFLISKSYIKEKETILKYGSSGPKETYTDRVRRIKSMDEQELTKYLYSVGIFEDGPLAGTTDVIMSFRMKNTDHGMMEMVKYTYPQPEYNVENEGRTLNKIINELIKNKLI